MHWEVLTFDCYGTLVDWESGIVNAFTEAAAAEGVVLDPGAVVEAYMEVEPEVEAGPFRPYREVLAETARRVARRLDWEMPSDRAAFLARSLPEWPLFEDTRPALERLRSAFDELAILSNVDDDLLRATRERIGVRFDWTVTAERVRSYKPAPAHFLTALDRLGGTERLLHVAASLYHDVAPALTLGLSVVWVNRNDEPVPEEPIPDHVVSDLNELADWLGA